MLHGHTEMKPVFLEISYGYVSGLGFICDMPDKSKGQPQRKVETYSLSPGFPVQPAPPGSATVK